jgi:hypothetical protein
MGGPAAIANPMWCTRHDSNVRPRFVVLISILSLKFTSLLVRAGGALSVPKRRNGSQGSEAP